MPKKQCKYCSKWYPETDFGVALTTPLKVYRRRKCRFCYRDTKQALTERYRQWIKQYKAERGCKVCGIKDQRVLDLHHRDESTKKFTVAYFPRAGGFENIRKEVEKCDVVCANCHRVMHFELREKAKGDG